MKYALIAIALAMPVPVMGQTPYEPPKAEVPRFDITPSPESPAQKQGDESKSDDLGQMLERGVTSLLRDFLGDVEPHMDAIGRELGSRFESLAPLLQEAGTLIDDLRNYQAPERLANGDILIRRKPDAPAPPPLSQQFQDLTQPPADLDPRLNPRPDQPAPSTDRNTTPEIDL